MISESTKRYNKEYRLKHKDQLNEYSRQYLNSHRDENKDRCRKWYLNNKQSAAQKNKLYRVLNKDKIKQYLNENSSRILFFQRQRNHKKKKMVMFHYSNGNMCCANCGDDIYEKLTIDHIDGGGIKHRKITGLGSGLYRWLVKNNYPEGFQVLCIECNWLKGRVSTERYVEITHKSYIFPTPRSLLAI